CVVGDDDQSIYKFRGANVGNILNFEKVFPDAMTIRLEQNYRSTGTILKAANAVIKNNVNRKAKTLWTNAPEGEKIRLFFVDNPYVEADRVVATVRKFMHDGYSLNSCACLYRTNAQSRSLEEAFIRANIPYKIVGGVNFYQRKEIKDIIAYLKTIDNGRDDIAVKRIINVPKRNIGAAAVNMVQSFADERGIGFYPAIETGLNEGIFGKAGEKLRPFSEMIDSFRKRGENSGVTELIKDIINDTGYLRELQLEQTPEADSRIENIEEFINKASAYEENFRNRSENIAPEDEFVMADDHPTLSGFLEEISLIADIDSWDSSDNYVSLITIHSAKGLEFDNVFLCGMEDGLFPMNASICSEDPSDLEEERRLAYVGITRARKHLILTAARSRMVRGETTVSTLSRFVREIPQFLLENDRDNIYLKNRNQEPEGRSISSGVKLSDKPYAFSSQEKRNPASAFSSYGSSSAGRKQFEVKNSSVLDYSVGDRVEHIKFGEGIVTAIDQGGKDFEVTVDFEEFGVKKMFAAFARLKKV
ncbi:MAG: ATP-binding domain-containing protein, partial [Parasporobacterium sp.]|nr:ATP-binding domain-containing protein [Parasporobacterium sp.]